MSVAYIMGFFHAKDLAKIEYRKPITESDYDVINRMAEELYTSAKDKGWHAGPVNVGNYVANIHGEVSELWESYRLHTMHKPCDKADKMKEHRLEPLTCGEEELADIFIRTLDTAQALDINLGRAVRIKHQFNQTRPYRHGGKAA